jgi:hypothetical protein
MTTSAGEAVAPSKLALKPHAIVLVFTMRISFRSFSGQRWLLEPKGQKSQ